MSVGRLLLSISAVMAVSVSCQSTVDMASCTQNNEDVTMVMKEECTQHQTLVLQRLDEQARDFRNSSLRLQQVERKQEHQLMLLNDMKHRQILDQNASSHHQIVVMERLEEQARDFRNASVRLQQVERQLQLMLLQQLQQQLNNVTDILQGRESECPGELSDNFRLRFNRTVAVIKSRNQLVTELRDCCNPLLIQQHVDGPNFFRRTWNEFRAGFSGSNGNYWLGNELLHQLTNDGSYKLRFDLQSRDTSQWYWAEYRTFTVHNESTGYRLHVGGYTGNVRQDALSWHYGMKFTTIDRDNDQSSGNCATRTGGGFWHNADCAHCNVNTMRGGYRDFSWWYLDDRGNDRLQTSRMWLMCQ